MEKVKPIILKDNEFGTEYTLEFNRESVKFAESRGFVFEDVKNYPQTMIEQFIFYSFRMHHKSVALSYVQHLLYDIWGGIYGIPDGFLERLGELYAATFNTLTDEERAEKNSKVTVEL